MTEYVCGCGHSFMKHRSGLKKIKHPVICTLFGHFVRFLGKRDGCSEYWCSLCGHTFCYASTQNALFRPLFDLNFHEGDASPFNAAT
jgi:hypothetical protein